VKTPGPPETLMRWIVISLLLGFLVGCASSGRVPVRDIGESKTAASDVHRVQKGDTLYSIAWRYGLDYKGLAAVNSIKSPYTIFVDQKIVLRGKPKKSVRKKSTQRKKTQPKPRTKGPSPPNVAQVVWQWPVKGEVIKEFSLSGNLNKGIDIKGETGARVIAAAAGVVVYAGGNLRGYGKLVIVKHNDRFLSAYGNNQDIRVQEGDRVTSGQMLARVGTSGSDIEMLHFEIRLNGKPENPLQYLPAL
jgi:lipoprotein NlpD|tara:strand:- start:756 stop:1496 length:741 start_codon:yes stop_codon:yes gene_type:complete